MLRGRPPLPRTKEEALHARREQVRKNVQAFRRKKQEQQDFNSKDKNENEGGNFTLGVENEGCTPAQYRPLAARDSGTRNPENVEIAKPHNLDIGSTMTNRRVETRDNGPLAEPGYYHLPFLILREISAAQVSLQQLASNASTAFMSGGSFAEVGPHWPQILPSLVNANPILDLSIQALCLMQTSTISGEPHLIQHSMSCYSRALQTLRNTITKPGHKFTMEIFAATMTLSGYELLQGDSGGESRGWMYHVEGATSYLNMFPPSSYDTFSCTHQVSFHFLESICIFDALGARRPTVFSTSKWWQVSIDKFGDENYGALLKLITNLPAFLESCDGAADLLPGLATAETLQILYELGSRLERAFLAWAKRTRTRVPAFRSVETKLSAGLTNATDIEFSNLYVARIYLLYWSSLVLLSSSMAMLQGKLAACVIPITPVTPASLQESQAYSSRAHNLALNIRHSVHYCLKPRHGIVGKSLILLPIWVARKTLKECGDGEARSWCDGVLEGLGHRNLSFGLKIKDLRCPYLDKEGKCFIENPMTSAMVSCECCRSLGEHTPHWIRGNQTAMNLDDTESAL